MRTRIIGVGTIVVAGIAWSIASWVLLLSARTWGLAYCAASLFAFSLALLVYCAKCPAKTSCAHVLPGWIALKMSRASESYTPIEIGVMISVFLILCGLPNLWLWRNPTVLAWFWSLYILAAILVLRLVCPRCDNVRCFACPRRLKD